MTNVQGVRGLANGGTHNQWSVHLLLVRVSGQRWALVKSAPRETGQDNELNRCVYERDTLYVGPASQTVGNVKPTLAQRLVSTGNPHDASEHYLASLKT